MTFEAFGVAAALGGLAVIAGVLFVLQRLRVRHREVRVPTTLFWKEAVEERRARVLMRRFRYPLVYLLALAIAGALWFAFARPRAEADGSRHRYTLLVDGSAGMAWGDRLADALDAAVREAEQLPAGSVDVIFCGARPRALLRRGEHARLLRERTRGLSADASPATVEAELRALASVAATGPRTVIVFGAAPLRDGVRALLPEGWDVVRRPAAAAAEKNAGIVALGVTEAASGAWDRVDVFVEVLGDGAPRFRLGDRPLAAARGRVLRDVLARGARFTVSLDRGGALDLDDEASITLPDRPPLRVRVDDALRAALAPVLAADSGIVLVESDADVEVLLGSRGEALVPALRFVAAGGQEEAFLLEDPSGDAASVLRRGFAALGLDEIDATQLAGAARRAIRLGARAGRQRELRVWRELLTDRYDFVQSRAFPLFLARALRWLRGARAFPSHVAAGEPVVSRPTAHRDAHDTTLATAGAPFTPPAAGVYRAVDAPALAVSLLDPHATTGATAAARAGGEETVAAGRGGMPAWTWLALAALVLLLLEWFLFATGRIP